MTEAPITETEPPASVEGPSARPWWKLRRRRPKPPKRPLLARLFGIGIWGSIKLIVLCILVGFVLLTAQFDPASPDFDATETLSLVLHNAAAAAQWAATNFWKPALAGATLILPIWILWRLATLPFRR